MKRIFRNIGTLLTMDGVAHKRGRLPREHDLGMLRNAAIVVNRGLIEWIGHEGKIPKAYSKISDEVDFKKRTVLPGFIECHTHTLFAGSRALEFEWRNQGLSYQEIAERGGGILSTMRATRESAVKDLKKMTQKRVDRFLEQGVCTLEIKSGYALDLENELKSLEVAKSMKGPEIVTTFLGAHTKPPEFKTFNDYLEYLLSTVAPQILKKKLSRRIDIFIEKGFFSTSMAKAYLQKAQKLGFDVCIHADQLSESGGTELAVELKALSADHVIEVGDKTIQKLARSSTTAVLLPAADLYLRCNYPRARDMIDAGVQVALSTDYNPGTSPTQDLALVGLLARLEMKMSLAEVLAAYTYNAASALGLQKQQGSLQAGHFANVISIDSDWTELFYSIGTMNVSDVYVKGEMRHKL